MLPLPTAHPLISSVDVEPLDPSVIDALERTDAIDLVKQMHTFAAQSQGVSR